MLIIVVVPAPIHAPDVDWSHRRSITSHPTTKSGTNSPLHHENPPTPPAYHTSFPPLNSRNPIQCPHFLPLGQNACPICISLRTHHGAQDSFTETTMQLQRLPLSLALMVLSTVVNGVPIWSTTDDTEPTAVWVTETVWPCEPSSLAAATGSGVGNVQKADYDTVPVDGGSNAEAVPEGAAESSSATRNPTSDPPMTSSSVDPPMPSSSVDPTTNDPPPSTTFPVMLYTPVTSDPMTVDPSSTYVQVDEQAPATDPIVSDLFTSDPVSSDPTTALPVPVFSTYTPDAFVASTTSIPAMPTLAPTIVFPSNGTNTTC